MFGKTENGVLRLAPKKIEIDGMVCYNPDEDTLRSAGYLPIENTPRPGDNYAEIWEEKDGKIVQAWIEIEEPQKSPQGMTSEERLCQVESELSALRQKNELLRAEVMYLCMMNGIEPTEV